MLVGYRHFCTLKRCATATWNLGGLAVIGSSLFSHRSIGPGSLDLGLACSGLSQMTTQVPLPMSSQEQFHWSWLSEAFSGQSTALGNSIANMQCLRDLPRLLRVEMLGYGPTFQKIGGRKPSLRSGLDSVQMNCL